jgi:cytochrome c-type biogenesis protein CcmH
MTGLWIAVAVMIAGTLGAVLLPFVRQPKPAPARAEFDAAVYRDQIREVDRDAERGLLGEERAEAARTEIQRRLLAAAGEGESGPTAAPGSGQWLLGALAVAVPAGAIALYLHLGSPTAPDQPLAARPAAVAQSNQQSAQAAEGSGEEAPDVGGMIERLAERLAEDPEDLDGWRMLGRSYRVIDRYAESADAYLRAVELSKRRGDTLIDYGEALALLAEGHVAGPARAIFEEALGMVPDDPRPRFYIAIAQTQEGDLDGALKSWIELEAVSPPDAPWLADIRARIKVLGEKLGIDPTTIKPTTKP